MVSVFAEVEGRENVECFINMAKYLIIDKWHVGMIYVKDAEQIIITAVKIV